MKTIRLPVQLPPQSRLQDLNRLLRANAICLDWSDVQADLVTPQQLDTLLHGLILSVHIECIGENTISETLSHLISEAFYRAENDVDATISRPIRTKSQALPPPEIWTPPTTYPSENEAECTIIRQKLTVITRQLPYENESETDITALADLCLDMFELSQAKMTQLPDLLQPLVVAYAHWIEKESQHLLNPHENSLHHQTAAQKSIKYHSTMLHRIQDGIHLISTQKDAAQAFAFMNRAMWLQRIHNLGAEEKRKKGIYAIHDINQPANRSWRPFQLAFILANISAPPGLNHHRRNTIQNTPADLLWFPPGSGKTEVYLGLTSYRLGIHRLRSNIEVYSGERGMVVIMHSTTRPLTQQRFQRAAALICACEIIRNTDSSTWGTTPFHLGLWAEQQSMPKPTSEATEVIHQVYNTQSNNTTGHGKPGLLTHCPWCGSAINAGRDSVIETDKQGHSRTLIYCGDPKNECIFSPARSKGAGLPVLLVEEEIARLLPDLLLTTVDRVARLPFLSNLQRVDLQEL